MTNQLRTDDLPDPPSHWRALLRHPYADEFMKAANVEWEALFHKETWEIIDQDEAIQPILPLKWVFTYKTDSDGYLAKFKARLVVRGDLQQDNAQDVYAVTLAFKVFRALMALVAADHCLRYLYGTKYLGIQYWAKEGGEITTMANHGPVPANKQVFEATADASYANNPDRKSSEGYTFKLFGGMIDWAARKQLTVTTSTTEAKLLSMLHAGKELI